MAKKFLDNVNNVIRQKTLVNQWRSTDDVTTWFNGLERKETLTFIQFDIVSFYPSISEALLKDAINFARTFLNIEPDEERIILCAKRSLLYNENIPWIKKGGSDFDVTMGSYDGAETCELVGLYMLSKLSKINRVNVGLYRDDGLLVTPASPRQAELIKKKICAIFSEQGLKITAEANMKTVDFLNVTLNLEDGTYSPFNKPNNTPEYVHRLSNHPPSVLKNIPKGVNQRLSSTSSNEEIFEKAAPMFQQALEKSGHNYKLKFDPPKQMKNKARKTSRKRKILWFNPPYSLSVKTNIGKEFLKLIDKCFPKGHPLRKIINRQTVKVSYSTTHNIQKIISGKNAQILKVNKTQETACNCKKDSPCPLDGKCNEKNIIYKATVTQTNRTPKTYRKHINRILEMASCPPAFIQIQ